MQNRQLIAVVCCNSRNVELLRQVFEREGWQTLGADNLDDFDRVLAAAEKPSAALLDMSGFDRSIWDRCEQLRRAKIPFLMISPRQSADVQRHSLAQGARGMLVKPLAVKELLELIRGLL